MNIGFNAGSFTHLTRPRQMTKCRKISVASQYPINVLSILWASTAFYLILDAGLLVKATGTKGDTLRGTDDEVIDSELKSKFVVKTFDTCASTTAHH